MKIVHKHYDEVICNDKHVVSVRIISVVYSRNNIKIWSQLNSNCIKIGNFYKKSNRKRK